MTTEYDKAAVERDLRSTAPELSSSLPMWLKNIVNSADEADHG